MWMVIVFSVFVIEPQASVLYCQHWQTQKQDLFYFFSVKAKDIQSLTIILAVKT